MSLLFVCLFPRMVCYLIFQAVLYDDKGSKLDALHVHASDVVTGEQLESDRSGSPINREKTHTRT